MIISTAKRVRRKIRSRIMAGKYGDAEFMARQMSSTGRHFESRRVPERTAIGHYVDAWDRLRVNPRHDFDVQFYIEMNPDVREAGIEPFTHFVQSGFAEGRRPHPLVFTSFIKRFYQVSHDQITKFFSLLDAGIYVNPLVSEALPTRQWSELLAEKGRDLSKYFTFDYEAWISMQDDVVRLHPKHPIDHLFRYGLKESRLSKCKAVAPELLNRGGKTFAHGSDFDWVESASERLTNIHFDHLVPDSVDPSSAASAEVAVGVVFFDNSEREIDRLLRSIRVTQNASQVNLCVYALDNSQPNLTWLREKLRKLTNEPILIGSTSNIGFARGHNEMMRRAFDSGAEYYVGLNPDGFLIGDAIETAIAFSRFHGDDAIVELGSFPIGHPKWHHPITGETAWASGAAFLIPEHIFRVVGGFDGDFPMYGEDVDLSFRARIAGFQVRVSPRSKFFHDVTPRLEKIDRSRKLRELIGNWYLCKKWRADARADELFDQIKKLAGPDCNLPEISSFAEPDDDVRADLVRPRYAHSRFWEG